MKKVFGLLFVAGLFTFASCNNAEETATEVETTETVETVEVETEVEADTTATIEEDTTAVQ
ncbi:hypothetical protein Q4E40_19930 [Pontibacter sp. BT731]|uniref:Entericidin n=1 Tax=Pontibacter amylolyticus TaxID=1424080 RepID=A0ABQ1WHZ7_9BACT|nr:MULTISPECIES: hypothetical protein [Pontibacter]MCP2045648.1 hypothetical protein [Pontibacter sp. HSC-36F09]MDO6392415.1 hypothetical protein [Pontibacter sp. BT731]GGG31110.1 hypothetical protein GCM10011323_38110 [Pontibacter amylolyticus]